MKPPAFIDSVKLFVSAGRGGNGVISLHRTKYNLRGEPDGGDGGRGGDVILRADRNEYSLLPLFYAPHPRAENGGHGSSRRMHGANGKPLVVRLACGTQVVDAATGEVLGDLVEDGSELLVARGGEGGLGNWRWKRPNRPPPPEGHERGAPGAERTLRLELKLISDIGLVGYPNAGKSSLLCAISHAHPKVAAYPFTTLNPTIGTVLFDDYSTATVADVPGLVKGAHEGVGLGHNFLRHIERTTFLLYVVDMAGTDGRDPVEDYESVSSEVKLHRRELAERPFLVVANKMDLPAAPERLAEFVERTGERPIPVSAETGAGVEALKAELCARFRSRQA
ncbi:MAG: GTPase ObgE [Kiritimatiellae bacterium]|nr:GTPase ObgE [Kiritimatiellia bacterium]